MITTSFVLALLVTVSFGFEFKKFPLWIRRFFLRHKVLTDCIFSWLTFMVLGFTATGVMAAAMVSLFVSIYLYMIQGQYQKEEKSKKEKT